MDFALACSASNRSMNARRCLSSMGRSTASDLRSWPSMSKRIACDSSVFFILRV